MSKTLLIGHCTCSPHEVLLIILGRKWLSTLVFIFWLLIMIHEIILWMWYVLFRDLTKLTSRGLHSNEWKIETKTCTRLEALPIIVFLFCFFRHVWFVLHPWRFSNGSWRPLNRHWFGGKCSVLFPLTADFLILWNRSYFSVVTTWVNSNCSKYKAPLVTQ